MQYCCSRVYSLKRSQFWDKIQIPNNQLCTSLSNFTEPMLHLLICQKGHVKCNKDTVQMACSLLQYGSRFGCWYQTLWTKYPQQKKWSKHLPVQVPLHLTTYSSNIVKCTFQSYCGEFQIPKNDSGIHFCIIYK